MSSVWRFILWKGLNHLVSFFAVINIFSLLFPIGKTIFSHDFSCNPQLRLCQLGQGFSNYGSQPTSGSRNPLTWVAKTLRSWPVLFCPQIKPGHYIITPIAHFNPPSHPTSVSCSLSNYLVQPILFDYSALLCHSVTSSLKFANQCAVVSRITTNRQRELEFINNIVSNGIINLGK